MNEQLIEYYINLLIIQYYDKPKARAYIESVITGLMIYDIAIMVRDGFNIDTAIGAQLDILAKYIGAERTVTGVSFDRDYFGYELYDSVSFTFFGYADYTSATIPDEQFREYIEENRSLFDLNDEELRLMLKLKIIKNTDVGSMKVIDDLLTEYFGLDILFWERYPMKISYIFKEEIRRLVTIAQAEDLLPKPAAVGISVAFTKDTNHIFSYKKYGMLAPDFAVGYSKYGESITGGMAFYGQT